METLPSLRTDNGNQTAGAAAANANAQNFPLQQFQQQNTNTAQTSGNTVAAVSASASASVTNATAAAQTLGEARVDPATGASLNTPQANATVGGQGSAMTSGSGTFANSNWNMAAVTAGATLQVQGTPTYPTGPATATETVTVIAAGGDHPLPGQVVVSASAGATNLRAQSMGGGGWQITGVQSRSSASDPNAQPTMINEFVPDFHGVNRTVVGTQVTAVGGSLNIAASVTNAGDGTGPQQTSNWSFSAHGSFTVNSP